MVKEDGATGNSFVWISGLYAVRGRGEDDELVDWGQVSRKWVHGDGKEWRRVGEHS